MIAVDEKSASNGMKSKTTIHWQLAKSYYLKKTGQEKWT